MGAWFIDLDRTTGSDGVYTPTLLLVFKDLGEKPGESFAYAVQRGDLRCASRIWAAGRPSVYTKTGEFMFEGRAKAPIPVQQNDMADHLAQVLCDGVKLPQTNIVTGYQAAGQWIKTALKVDNP